MMAKERKFSSTLSTSNSGVTQSEFLTAIFIHFQPERSLLGGEENINVEMLFDFKRASRLDF